MSTTKQFNKLQIIKQNAVKRDKLKEAQLVMAKKKEA